MCHKKLFFDTLWRLVVVWSRRLVLESITKSCKISTSAHHHSATGPSLHQKGRMVNRRRLKRKW